MLKYGQILVSIKEPCYNVIVGQGYVQENVEKHFLVFPDGSSRLVRDDVIERHFKEAV